MSSRRLIIYYIMQGGGSIDDKFLSLKLYAQFYMRVKTLLSSSSFEDIFETSIFRHDFASTQLHILNEIQHFLISF